MTSKFHARTDTRNYSATFYFKFDESLRTSVRHKIREDLLLFLHQNNFSERNGFQLQELTCREGSTEIIIVFILKGIATGILSALGGLFFSFVRRKILGYISSRRETTLMEENVDSDPNKLILEKERNKVDLAEQEYKKINQIEDPCLPVYQEFPEVVGLLKGDFTATLQIKRDTPDGKRLDTFQIQCIDGKVKKRIRQEEDV